MTKMLSTHHVAPTSGPLPGLALCAVATALAMGVNHLVPTVSPLLIAIVAGAVVANVYTLPPQFSPGVAFSAKRLLRLGIALLGMQLVLGDIARLGWGMIVVVITIVGLGVAGAMYVGARLGLTYTQRVLIACGFSICGAAAVAAADGVVDADEEEVATAVALVVLFGTLMIPAIPLASNLLGLSEIQAGMWAGGSIHEVAQVVAAGGAIGASALAVAVVVKLARVLMLAPMMAVLSIRRRRELSAAPEGGEVKRPPLVPLFVIGFIAMMLLRSTSLVPAELIAVGRFAQTALLTAAMFALGLGVRVATMRAVGPRPVVLAAVATAWVSAIALVGVLVVTH